MTDLANAQDHWNGLGVTALEWGDGEFLGISQPHILAIKPYSEPGEMSPTIWFEVTCKAPQSGAVYYGRINGAHIREVYFESPDG